MQNTQIDFNKQFSKFKNNISLTENQRENLIQTRKSIREKLRSEFEGVKFFTQGSFAYNTLNVLYNISAGQQMDLDDGMYISQKLQKDTKPSLCPKKILEKAESGLQELCNEKEWKIYKNKKTCIRIEISGDCHIDIPIYVISEDRMSQLNTLLEKTEYKEINKLDFSRSLKDEYDAGDVWLALRDGGWQMSDPRLIAKHIEVVSKNHLPYSYKNVVRYFKAWRDFQFEKSNWSSICLMVAVDQAMQRVSSSIKEKGTLNTVHSVSNALIDIMQNNKVFDPIDQSTDLKEKIKMSELNQIVDKLIILRDNCQKSYAENTTKYLRDSFGKRFPLCPEISNKIQNKESVQFGRNTSSA